MACAQLTSTASRIQSPSVSGFRGFPPNVYSSRFDNPSLSLSISDSSSPSGIATVRLRPKLTSKMSGIPSLSVSVTLSNRSQSAYHEERYGAAISVDVTINPISRFRTIAESPQLMLEMRTDSPSTMAPLLCNFMTSSSSLMMTAEASQPLVMFQSLLIRLTTS